MSTCFKKLLLIVLSGSLLPLALPRPRATAWQARIERGDKARAQGGRQGPGEDGAVQDTH